MYKGLLEFQKGSIKSCFFKLFKPKRVWKEVEIKNVATENVSKCSMPRKYEYVYFFDTKTHTHYRELA